MKYSILLSNNNRSKAYLQNLVKNGFVPEQAIVLNARGTLRPENTDWDVVKAGSGARPVIRASLDAEVHFDESEHVVDTLEAAGVNISVLDTVDVNSESVVSAVQQLESDYIVYSGPGGTILRKNILAQGKEFIHVHPGWLPTYRGSTTLYYSLLVDKSVSCSVFLMRETIDTGPLLYRKTFPITEANVDFDYVLDPAVRAATLLQFFFNAEELLPQQSGRGDDPVNTFYIIHPVLKHLAVLGVKGQEGKAA